MHNPISKGSAMRLHVFKHANDIKHPQSKRTTMDPGEVRAAIEFAEWHLGRPFTELERDRFITATIVPGEDPLELTPVARVESKPLAESGEVLFTYGWSGWDYFAFCAPWASLGLLTGGVIVALICRYT